MKPQEFKESRAGRVIKHPTGYFAFVPNPLPMKLEQYSQKIVAALSVADQKIGELNGLCYRLSNPHLLSGAYMHREAVLSSRIEGTQSRESDLYLFGIDPHEERYPSDTREVYNYVSTLQHVVNRLEVLPLSLRLIREIHDGLLTGVRGHHKSPGEFRVSQNWIGGRNPNDARFVPPPVDEMRSALDSFEKFLHRPEPGRIPPLIECALVHYQFEAIHPFLDGNGRVGRLLLTLLAIQRGCLKHPLLYLSAYFERLREDYVDHLYRISQTGNWEPWLLFFLTGVAEQADDAMKRATIVLDLHAKYHAMDITQAASKVVDTLFTNPFVTNKEAVTEASITAPTAGKAIRCLCEAGIISPLEPKRKRGQIYLAQELYEAFTRDLRIKGE